VKDRGLLYTELKDELLQRLKEAEKCATWRTTKETVLLLSDLVPCPRVQPAVVA